MIAMLTGTLVSLGQSDAIIQVGGVGYYFHLQHSFHTH